MSSSGAQLAGYVKPAAGRTYMLGGQGQFTGGAQTAGGLRLYPVRIPFAVPFLALGVNVTGAGDAASTLTPVIFACTANGDPAAPIYVGSALSSAAVALVTGGPAGVLPAGSIWAGALCLSPGVAPTVSNLARTDEDPRGPFAPSDNPAGTNPFPFQSGLAAVPNPFAGTYIASTAPMLCVVT